MQYPFIVFGSPSSLDYDILVLVPALGSIAESKAACLTYEAQLATQLPEKKVNVNLGVVVGDTIGQVFKGTADEVNNSLLDTYHFHRQWHPNPVRQRVVRDINQKVLRALRVILSFYSRTTYRESVKAALRSDLWTKVATLERMDLAHIQDFTKGENRPEDIVKNVAFQMGQARALLHGVELYSKEAIGDYYPVLSAALQREKAQEPALEAFKQEFLADLRQQTFVRTQE